MYTWSTEAPHIHCTHSWDDRGSSTWQCRYTGSCSVTVWSFSDWHLGTGITVLLTACLQTKRLEMLECRCYHIDTISGCVLVKKNPPMDRWRNSLLVSWVEHRVECSNSFALSALNLASARHRVILILWCKCILFIYSSQWSLDDWTLVMVNWKTSAG